MGRAITKCDKVPQWQNGECCCNCANQIQARKHPWNTGPLKGPVDEHAGFYVCTVDHDMDNSRVGIVLESRHGYCEVYVPHKPNKHEENEV